MSFYSVASCTVLLTVVIRYECSMLYAVDDTNMNGQEEKMDPSTVKKLANRIKACTFLPYMNDADWTNDVMSTVEEFISTDHRQMLCLFYENDLFKATFCIPDARTDTIMWFLKTATDKENARLDNSNFLKLVSFGKMDVHVEKTMFLLLDSLYSPFIFSWTAGEKDQFFEQYRAVIQELCSLRYKFLGMPSIYIPTIVGTFDESSKSVSEETLRVLENILNVYTLEIQKCLMDNERVPTRCEYMMPHITDEMNYWKNRLTNIKFITNLLSYKSVDEILKILKQHQSIIVNSFNNIMDEIEAAKVESESNLNYLQILLEPVMSLYDVNSPNDILIRLPDIFMKFIFIFEESSYYNKCTDINRLFEYLGNQIVFICRKTIKMSELFSGNTESVLDKLQISMNCCENYIAVHTEVVLIYNAKNDGRWSVETNDVHMFLDRCKDVNYICKSMILFKRLNGDRPIPKPKFSFTKGLEFERVMDSIESRFNKLINDLENVQNVIFNVNTTDWYQHELEFKDEVKELCTIIEQLLNDALSITCNLEDALNVLQSLHYFSGWPQLNPHFKKKTNEVYAMLIDDISRAMQFYTGNSYRIPSFMVQYSGVCITARTEFKRITTLKNMITERPWLLHCTNINKLQKMYANYMTAYHELINNTFEIWKNQSSNAICEKQLEKNILVGNQNDQFWNLTTNMDCDTYNLITEIEYWFLIGFKNVFNQSNYVTNSKKIKQLHRNTSKIVNDYNTLIAGLSEQEMLLFSELIEMCNRITSTMIQNYTWKQLDIDSYLLDCFDEIEMVQDVMDDYKYCNIEIVGICEEISNFTLFEVNQVHILELKNLKRKIETMKSNMIVNIFDKYNLIIKYIMVIFKGFEDHIDNIMIYWTKYVRVIDNLICKALTLNCQCSLENILELSVGDGSGPMPVILINVSLEDDKIKYYASLTEILAFSVNIFTDLLTSIKVIPRLGCKLKLPTNNDTIPYEDEISNDWVCIELQEKNNLATINALKQLRRYMREFLALKDIWSMNKSLFFEKYKTFNSSATFFNQDMSQYSVYKRQISRIRPVAQVGHFIVQTNTLKDEIIRHCDEWRKRFSDLLLEMTTNLVEGFYRYSRTNSLQVMTPPKNLSEMISFTELRKRIVLEYDNKAKEFTLISDNVKVLEMNNIRMPDAMKTKYEKLFKVWSKYKNTLEDAEIMLKTKQNEFMNTLMEKQTKLRMNAKNLLQMFLETAPISTEWNSNDALNYTERIQEKLEVLKTEENQLNDDLAVFKIKYIHSTEIGRLQEEILVLHSVWKLVNTWDNIWKEYKNTTFWDVQVSDVKITVDTFFDQFNILVNGLKYKKWEVIQTTRNCMEEFLYLLPVIDDLKNPAMQVRHWDEVRNILNKQFDETSSDFTLEKLMGVKIQNFNERIHDVSKKSTMELNLENAIKNIKEIWSNMCLDFEPYKDKSIYYVKVNDSIFQSLEDHLVQLSVIKTSKYISVFLNEADFLEKSLGLIMEVLETILSVQRQRIYLENIFMGDDIRQKMPIESIDYDILTEEWKEITVKMHEENNLFRACYSRSLFKHLNTMNYRLEVIQRALEVYMESKRHVFPRFYFISNRELLEILGNSKNPDSIQPHLKKLFKNIYSVKIITNDNQKKEARGMFSEDGEYVDWNQPVICDGPAEVWLNSIGYIILMYFHLLQNNEENAMRDSLKHTLKQVKTAQSKNSKTREKWILEWPGQLCITVSQIQWTADCTRALMYAKNLKHKYPLKKMLKKQKKLLTKLSKVVQSTFLTNTERLKVTTSIVIEVHARDVIEFLYKSNCMDVYAFEWISQMRFYWDKKTDDLVIKQTNTKHLYGYEYLGNSGRLVITPLTDRCYITLTTALHMCRGGYLQGTTYTGKTETIKDLGKHLAQYVIVVNCSKSLDYKCMMRILLGIVQQGAWSCFDEIHRIKTKVLSSVTQQILSIFSALAANSKNVVIENDNIALVPTCGIFITTGPDHDGNSKLSDNFKSMFRSVSMIVPDRKLIAETMLLAEGFKDATALANKICTLFSLSRQLLLGRRNHYDYGLRRLIDLIRFAGLLRRENSEGPDDEIFLLAVYKMSLSNLTKDDLPVFMDITNNLFPDVTPLNSKNDILIDAIQRCLLKNNHQLSDSFVMKIVQLYEIMNFKRSVIILGNCGAAKSTTWKTLRDTLTLLKKEQVDTFETVIDYVLNPKTLTVDELHGKYNHITHEWMDGILSSILRKICSDSGLEKKWVIFDGSIDSGWVENMSSAMDDSKIFNLSNGERISIPTQVSFIFETDDLGSASPAMISRCGIVYNNHNDRGWRLIVDSWLNDCKFKFYREEMKLHFDQYIDDLLTFKRLKCTEIVPLADQACIISLCKLLECCTFDKLADKIPNGSNDSQYKFLLKIWFIFCMIWSVCNCVNENGKNKIDAYIRGLENVFPVKDTVYHYYVDNSYCKFKHWEEKIAINTREYITETEFSKIIIPTVDTIRNNYLIQLYLNKKQPILLAGPKGCGKTLNVRNALEIVNQQQFSFLSINMSAQTTSDDVQEMIEEKLEKRTKELYIPLTGKTMVTFLDDLHMPTKEPCGAQPSLELLRQWIDYGYWYDKSNQCPKYVKNLLLICAMTVYDGVKHSVSDRILSRFNIINVPMPTENDTHEIYRTILGHHLKNFDETVSELGDGLTSMTIGLHKNVIIKMIPTPAKVHYLFDLRDVSKVVQGLLRSNVKYQNFKVPMLRLWCHEVFRVFYDRLVDENDRKWFVDRINEQLEKNYNLTYRDLCTSEKNPIFCNFLNEAALYEEIVDEEPLKKFIEDGVKEYNSNPEFVPLDILLFRDYIEHICRIVRVISQPMGHILLIGIGGSGRSSIAKIASWLCKYSIFTVELSKSYGTSEFKKDLKLIYSETGIKNQPTSFVFDDAQIVDDSFLKIVNNILCTGEVTKLFKQSEFEEIKITLSEVTNNLSEAESTETINSFFIDRVKHNLHFILSFSPLEKSFRKRLQQYPALLNLTTIDWFLDWPKETLMEVAYTSLSNFDISAAITGEKLVNDSKNEINEDILKNSLASIFAFIHQSVLEYSNRIKVDTKHINNVTPAIYLEMISRYKEILKEKRVEKQRISIKLRNGLQKINNTNRNINEMTKLLEETTEHITERTKECEEMSVIISKRIKEIDIKKKEIDAFCVKVKENELKCQEMYDLVLAELKLTINKIEEATNRVCALNKKDLSDIKCFSVPPEGVKLVLEAVMTFKQADPSWAEAKRQLDDPSFLNQLKDFEKDQITDDILKQIDLFTKNPEFDLEKIGTHSTAAKYLGMWVIAIEKYAKMYRALAPKRASADVAMASVKEEQISLGEFEGNLTETQNLLEKQKIEYDEKMTEKEDFIDKAEELKNNLEKATKLIDGLSKERKKWNKTVDQIDMEFDYLPGDCVLSTAFVSYMGPFKYECREFLMNLWSTFIRETCAPINLNFEAILFLTDPATIRNWNIHGLSNDRFSLENGIIVSQSYRYPFIIDPDDQAWKWIKNIEKDNGLLIIDYRSKNSMQNLEKALKNGYPTLMRIDFENIDPHIISILSKSIVKQRNELFIRMGNKLLPYDEHFRIFITTKIKIAAYSLEVITRTTVVDFTIRQEGLEEQLLKILVNIENPGLEELKDNTVVNIEKDKNSLVKIQDELLKLLDESECSLLENEQLLQTLKSSKASSYTIKEQLQSSLASQAEIYIAREGYRPCARRASVLYFILKDLNKINSMYQLSLDFYIGLFQNSIKKSNAAEQLHERITNMNEYHTYAVYENVCRGLFQNHKLLFAFQICIKILLIENKINDDELQFILNGGTQPNGKENSTTKRPDWLPTESWNEILALSNLPGFYEVDKSFEQFSTEWCTWYMAPDPENLELIGQWENDSKLFQRLLFVRCLRFDRLSFSIKHFVSKNLGSRFTEPPVLTLKNIQNNLNNKNPLIFILSSGVEPTNILTKMAEDCNMKEKLKLLSLGNGLETVATNLIQNGQKEGHWIFLANCHLLISWMPQLDKIIETMQDGETHPEFRLLLSSKPHPKFPITLLQTAIKVSVEQPKSLKSGLLWLYQNINEEQFSQTQSTSNYKKILFNLCVFHSILVERKKFSTLGWNKIYDFNDHDFEASEIILSNYLNEYEEPPWTALKYLIGHIFYGGNITDVWDKRLLETYVNQFFNESATTTSFYKLSLLMDVQVPENGSLQLYKDFIKTLPCCENTPQVFGQHRNANVIYLRKENHLLCETLGRLQDRYNGPPDDNYKYEKIVSQSSQILQNIPALIEYKTSFDNVNTERNISDFVLLQEVTQYNNLLKEMKLTLTVLTKAIAGIIVTPTDIENTLQSIYEGKVPEQWLKTYPSLMNLGAWMNDLIERVKYFTGWAKTNQQPASIWLGAFTSPNSFLTGVLQKESKKSSVQIDLLCWTFVPIQTSLNDITIPPSKGVYVHNLYLEGAGWDEKNMCLCEPMPLQLITELPVLHFIPEEGKRKLKEIYQSPVYYCPIRSDLQEIDSSIVILNLKSGSQAPDHWIKRATAVLLNLGS